MDNDDKIELLKEAGEALFGSNWKTEFARHYDINDRSVRQWANGERTIPDTIIRSVISLLRDRANLMHSTADYICREIRFSDAYRELKITWLSAFNPTISNPAITESIDWFDVDGYIYGLSPSDLVIDTSGNPVELKNATVDELRAKMQSVINSPGYGVD